jgi:hypothetical protein
VEYATADNHDEASSFSDAVLLAPSSGEPDGTAHVRLTGLEPGTRYVYRVVLLDGDKAVEESPLGAFRTAPAAGQPVQFAVLSDTQWQWEGVNRLEMVGDAIAADPTPFDFILHGGDLVESPAAPYWDHWFASLDDMLLRAAFIPVLGNHERNHRSYYNAFELPPGAGKADKQWWALHWGDVVIVGLDSNVKRADQYLDQQAWAREHLTGAEPHKVVIFHHPVFSSDAYHGDGYGYDVIFHPIFVETGVDLVLNGHAHNYERIERDGITYLVLGGGGATPRPLAETRAPGSVRAIEGHHFYARVSTSEHGIAVEVVSVAREREGVVRPTAGRTLDSFSQPPREPVIGAWLWLLLGFVASGALLWALLRGATP